MKYIIVYLTGILFLIAVIIINTLAGFLGLMNWYQFIDAPDTVNFVDCIWLFVGYPITLGLAAIFVTRNFYKS